MSESTKEKNNTLPAPRKCWIGEKENAVPEEDQGRGYADKKGRTLSYKGGEGRLKKLLGMKTVLGSEPVEITGVEKCLHGLVSLFDKILQRKISATGRAVHVRLMTGPDNIHFSPAAGTGKSRFCFVSREIAHMEHPLRKPDKDNAYKIPLWEAPMGLPAGISGQKRQSWKYLMMHSETGTSLPACG